MIKENKSNSIHLRLTDDQYSYCDEMANMLGVGVSDFIRMSINAMVVASKRVNNVSLGDLGLKTTLGDLEHENFKTNQ